MTKDSDRGPPDGRSDDSRDPDLQGFLDDELVRAAEHGEYDRVRAAIAAGANVHRHNELPLSLAAARGHAEIVRLLLIVGADVSVHEHKPLRDAEANGHHETVRVLREAGSYDRTIAGDFERAIADHVLRDARANGSTEPAEQIRAKVQRIFDLRRAAAKRGIGQEPGP